MTALYTAWFNMKQRCDNPKRKDYKYYGGKGISYDLSWKTFGAFARDMRQDWAEGLELDRRNCNGPYTKDNCRWVDVKTSRQNRGLFKNNTSGIKGVGSGPKGFRARAGIGGREALYSGPDFFEACCARKSWEAKRAAA